MAELSPQISPDIDMKSPHDTLSPITTRAGEPSSSSDSPARLTRHESFVSQTPRVYRTYKRRWFGLIQLVLLNIVVSWDWLTFAAVSSTSSTYFVVPQSSINWLSTAFLFAFCAASPLVIYTLHSGPKPSIITSSCLILLGNWIRYGGTRSNPSRFGVVMLGQILIGLAQPFVLAAPTRYSDLWFSERGRVSATAVASLANPLGGALGQLIGPFWATKPSEVPNMVLYTAILSTVAALPSFFLPGAPPTPASASSSLPKTNLRDTLRGLSRNRTFYLILLPFGVYVGFFNAFSSLINQILEPYSFSESDAGICGALLILIGLVAAAVTSPIIDRTKAYATAIKVLIPFVAVSYLIFIWMPETRSLAPPYLIASVLGAASFALVPIALEFLVEVTWPASPEASSTICWASGQLLGAIFILIMNALQDGREAGEGTDDGTANPPGNLKRGLVFEAVVALAVVPLPMLIGIKSLGFGIEGGRLAADRRTAEGGIEGGEYHDDEPAAPIVPGASVGDGGRVRPRRGSWSNLMDRWNFLKRDRPT